MGLVRGWGWDWMMGGWSLHTVQHGEGFGVWRDCDTCDVLTVPWKRNRLRSFQFRLSTILVPPSPLLYGKACAFASEGCRVAINDIRRRFSSREPLADPSALRGGFRRPVVFIYFLPPILHSASNEGLILEFLSQAKRPLEDRVRNATLEWCGDGLLVQCESKNDNIWHCLGTARVRGWRTFGHMTPSQINLC